MGPVPKSPSGIVWSEFSRRAVRPKSTIVGMRINDVRSMENRFKMETRISKFWIFGGVNLPAC